MRLMGGVNYQMSIFALIGANLIPLAGVLVWNWSVFEVVIIYWLENVILGITNILKMIACSPDINPIDLKGKFKKHLIEKPDAHSEEQTREVFEFAHKLESHKGKLGALHHAAKLFFIPFFTVHYGFFCLVHGVFVFALLGKNEFGGDFLSSTGSSFDDFFALFKHALEAGGVWAALGLALSHLFSFFANYLGKGEYQRTVLPMLMMAPYGRIVILHLAMLFGAYAIMALGSPVYLLVILIVGKIMLDLKLHPRAHKKLAVAASATE